ncbi:MAG: phage tail protein [Pelagibacteraceae bacterium]
MALPILIRLVSLSGKGRDFPTKSEISRQIKSDIKLNVRSDYKRLERRLNAIERKQLPFAFSKTLNKTAEKVKEKIALETFPESFDVRSKGFAKATLAIERSNKRKLVARVYDRFGRANLMLHAKGGIKKAKSRSLAIPGDKLRKRRRAKGMPDASKPKEILKQPRTFVATMKSGKHGIFQRRGKKRLPIDLLYSFKRSAVIKKAFRFYEDANKVVHDNLSHIFNRELKAALRSAKR